MQLDDTFNFDLSYFLPFLGVILPSEVTYLPKENKAEQINVQGCILQFGVN